MTRAALLLAAVLVLAGCSNPHLTRDRAARIIRESARFREPGFVGVAGQEAPFDCKTKVEQDADWRALARTGWLELRSEDDYERGSEGRPAVKCVGTLSGDGLRAGAVLDTGTYDEWRVTAATRELVAVKSITSAEDGISTVRFTYRWRLNAFGGQILQPGPELAGAAVLRFVARGWQLADFTNLPDFAPTRQP
jgi:hypothetical protein